MTKKGCYWLLGLWMVCIQVEGQTTLPRTNTEKVTMARETLLDKIKGGWAGQTIGVTFGWPTEFVHLGTFIPDGQTIPWSEDYVRKAMQTFPGLYDDIYMDLTFVSVFQRCGLMAPVDSFAQAYARAGYDLWHANQAGRYNILQGMKAPQSGHYLNNPHADDIDFQIEADFAGLMTPGMPTVAAEITDKIGHIMNSGDGWYGGVYVATMYSLAFVSTDVNYVVKEALKAIPQQSKFYQCINDVIGWHRQYPDDWKKTWFEIQRKWAEEVGCPDGVFQPLNIDAKVNAAYVVLGLLYGKGDFTQTLEITTRTGQDSDCNPSTAAGILGTMIGYQNIPAYWLNPLKKAEDLPFSYTSLSLNAVYELSYAQALETIRLHHGRVGEQHVEIQTTRPVPVRLEENFKGHYPVEKKPLFQSFGDSLHFTTPEAIGLVIRGHVRKKQSDAPNHLLRAALYIDGTKVEEANFPTQPSQRRTELFWRYHLPKGAHVIIIKILNPHPAYELVAGEYLYYTDQPVRGFRSKSH